MGEFLSDKLIEMGLQQKIKYLENKVEGYEKALKSIYDIIAYEDDKKMVDVIVNTVANALKGQTEGVFKMNAYQLIIKGVFYTFLHEKTFTENELESMVNQAISELKWNGIERTYGNEINYMTDYFGFKFHT